ncbi:hypothetical protein SAMN05892877_109267 [Rhizobium subbaraonis]|uniref:Uncharacterized protein n=1 Tax=Rhizobium subbaraonis TaxID=908946 RepID=A0A285UKD7_9HYPH|nr:hypothetical protein [Rhizobium subbaraonis]SOC42233.1 hypothetical protein SAMN05892877_109267 [Rhizobium subbaraonis]
MSNESNEPISGALGANIMGPRNIELERQNPDMLRSPYTDAGTVPNLKFSFSAARNRLAKGGPRDVLARNFGVAESAFANLPVDVEHDRWILPATLPARWTQTGWYRRQARPGFPTASSFRRWSR